MNDEKASTVRILVVDDEKEICRIFLKSLSSGGYEAKAVTTGGGAVSLVKQTFFNLVFLDIVMPGISGDVVLGNIKEISPDTEVIMMTGSLMSVGLMKELRKKGASGFLQKPFKLEEILEIIGKKGKKKQNKSLLSG